MKDGKYEGKDFINLPLPMPGEYDSLDLMAMRAIDFECKLTECLVCNAIRFGYSPADLVIYRQYSDNRYRYWLSTKKLCQIK